MEKGMEKDIDDKLILEGNYLEGIRYNKIYYN